MNKEATFEKKVVKHLKDKGCVVIKMQAGPGVPKGFPDRLFLKEGFWGTFEIKASKKSKYQPLQKERIGQLDEMSYSRAVYPENWEEIKAELETML